jgi:hypothetical protein
MRGDPADRLVVHPHASMGSRAGNGCGGGGGSSGGHFVVDSIKIDALGAR